MCQRSAYRTGILLHHGKRKGLLQSPRTKSLFVNKDQNNDCQEMTTRSQIDHHLQLNNEAVKLFEKGNYRHAYVSFSNALDTILLEIDCLKTTLSGRGDCFVKRGDCAATKEVPEPQHFYYCWPSGTALIDRHLLVPWSRKSTILDSLLLCQEGQNEDDGALFTFQRVAYLASPACQHSMSNEIESFQFCGAGLAAAASASYYDHATVILYNLATCLQLVSLHDTRGGAGLLAAAATNKKALHLYQMAFAAMQVARQEQHPISTMLQIVLFNNSGQLLYHQGNTCEAAKCFRKVRELLHCSEQVVTSSFHPADFSGLCLNSYIDIQTASAA